MSFASSTRSGTVLAVEPLVQRFSATDDQLPGQDLLLEQLRRQQDTRPVEITDDRQVWIGADGLVQGTYQLTREALSQLCSAVAPGLGSAVASLAGLRKRNLPVPEQYSLKLAIRLVNAATSLRFDLLKGKCLVVDRGGRRIEGLVSPKYYFYSNFEMYRRVDAFIRQVSPHNRFQSAAMEGRRLQLRYKNWSRAFAIENASDKLEPFYGGWHFSNSELGDCCLKGAAILYRQWSGTAAISPFDAVTKLVHLQSSKFNEKLDRLLTTVQDRVANIPELMKDVIRSRVTPLGLGGSAEQSLQRQAELEAALAKEGVPRQVAHYALLRAMIHGSYNTEQVVLGRGVQRLEVFSPQILKKLQCRTVYDLFNGLGYVARKVAPAQQEAIEQIAFRMLVQDFTFKE